MTPFMLSPLLFAQSDAQLIELARAGHERAFEVLVRRYRSQLLAHCRHIAAGDRAEDALQYGLLGAWLALQNGTRVGQARPWLYRVVHNACLRTWRDGREAELSESLSAAEGPEEQFDRAEDLRDALRALSALPELQRDALVQTALEGRSYENVADDLGVTPAALRGLLHRARASMRSAVSAITPTPLLGWLLTRGAPRAVKPAAAGLSAGGTGASATLVTKGAVAVLSAGALAAGAGLAHLVARSHPHRRVVVAAASPRVRTARVALTAPEPARRTVVLPAPPPPRHVSRGRSAPLHRSAAPAPAAAIVTAVATPRPAAALAPHARAASAAPTPRPAPPTPSSGSGNRPQGGVTDGSSHHDGQSSSDGSHSGSGGQSSSTDGQSSSTDGQSSSTDGQRSSTDGSSSPQTSQGSQGGGGTATTGTSGDG